MPISFVPGGTVDNSMIHGFEIYRTDGGELAARVTYRINIAGTTVARCITWALSAQAISALGGLLPEIRAAIAADLGVSP